MLCSAGATAASAATIGFEDLAATAPGPGGHGQVVNADYSNQGVLFNNVEAYDYSKGILAIPDFAHSGTVAVEQCVAQEFCEVPITATFTAAQRSVQVWVGYSRRHDNPIPIRLTAYNASNAVVRTKDVTLPASPSAATPITTPIAISRPNAVITKVEVASSTVPPFSAGIALDDLEFSTVGPPPPCNATRVPSIDIDQPQPGLVVNTNAFMLQGTVDDGGAPITSARIFSEGSGAQSGSAFPAVIGGAGPFGPVRYHGLLEPGNQKVFVTARNCRGTGVSGAVSLAYDPIRPGTAFRQFGEIEVTQSIQNPHNGVPLVGAANSGGAVKRTFARVYLGLEGSMGALHDVTGHLNAIRPGGSRPPGPGTIGSLNSIDVQRTATAESARSSLGASLLFELPPEWLGTGRLHLELDHLRIGGEQSSLPCNGCANFEFTFPATFGPAEVELRTSPPLRLMIVDAPYTLPGSPAAILPRQVDVDLLTSWLRRAYPTSDIQIRRGTLPVHTGAWADCNQVNATLQQWAAPTWHRPQRFYALVADNGGANQIGGCIINGPGGQPQFGGHFGSGPAGAPRANFAAWDKDGSYADAYGGHEIGHQFNRHHPGWGPRSPYTPDATGHSVCEAGSFQGDDDPTFPYADGLIGDAARDNQALDAGDAALGLGMVLGDWRTGWHDVMSYCDDQWPSAYTYSSIMKYMCNGDAIPFCLNTPIVNRSRERPKAAGAKGRRLLVTGRAKGSKLSLDPLSVLRGLELTERPKKSRYSIVLRGARDRVLARYPFLPQRSSDDVGGRRFIHVAVRFRSATREIEFRKGKRVVRALPVSDHAPKVRVKSPKKGAELGERVRVRWRGRDADHDKLTYTLLYSDGDGEFLPVASGIRKRSYAVDLSTRPGGPNARFKVIATDGVLTGSSVARRLGVPAKPPRALISTPASGVNVTAGETIPLIAAATDPQDDSLSGESIVWRSSLQGRLGAGPAISAALEPGLHEITATATNSRGLSDVAKVEVRAVAVPPTIEADVTG